MLSIVLHGTIAKMNQALFAARAGFHHLLLSRPCAFAGHVARHVGFTQGHFIFSRNCCCGRGSTRDPSPVNCWGDYSSGCRPCGRCLCHHPSELFPQPLLFASLRFYVHAPFSLLSSFDTFCTPSHNCVQGAFHDCTQDFVLSRGQPGEEKKIKIFYYSVCIIAW